jgi:hypothetical protein
LRYRPARFATRCAFVALVAQGFVHSVRAGGKRCGRWRSRRASADLSIFPRPPSGLAPSCGGEPSSSSPRTGGCQPIQSAFGSSARPALGHALSFPMICSANYNRYRTIDKRGVFPVSHLVDTGKRARVGNGCEPLPTEISFTIACFPSHFPFMLKRQNLV